LPPRYAEPWSGTEAELEMLKVPMLGIWTIWAWVLVPSAKIQAKAPAKRPNQHRVILDISMLMAVGTGSR